MGVSLLIKIFYIKQIQTSLHILASQQDFKLCDVYLLIFLINDTWSVLTEHPYVRLH